VRHALDRQFRHELQHRLHVDAGGRHDDIAEGAAMEVGSEIGLGAFHDLADQRVADRKSVV
jgi:hypothetical protein